MSVSKEKLCIREYVDSVKENLAIDGMGGFIKTMKGIPATHRHMEAGVKNIDPKAALAHRIGISVVGLGAIATYEGLRHYMLPGLPDSKEIVAFVLPAASITDVTPEQTEEAKRIWRGGHIDERRLEALERQRIERRTQEAKERNEKVKKLFGKK